MKNEYARDYYDSYLKDLPTDYKSARWFSSYSAKLDYDQTRRSLEAGLDNKQYVNVLEIGPGDGVWTDLLLPSSKKLTLLDQSVEMLNRAKERLAEHTNISYVRSDFLAYSTEEKFDLIFAIRCFEYFEDKDAAIEKMANLLNPGGRLVLVTKNPDHIRTKKIQEKELHSGQISKKEMDILISKHGFLPVSNLSATWRLKAKYFPMRILFRSLHWLHVYSKGAFMLPFLTRSLSESYLYVSEKK